MKKLKVLSVSLYFAAFLVFSMIMLFASQRVNAQPSNIVDVTVDYSMEWQQCWYGELTADSSFPNRLDWVDNVFNPENEQFISEVFFNHFYDWNPCDVDPTVVQYYFVERYYSTCTKSTQRWYRWMTRLNDN